MGLARDKSHIYKSFTLKRKAREITTLRQACEDTLFNTSEKNAYTKNLDMKKHWFNESTRNRNFGRWRRFPKS